MLDALAELKSRVGEMNFDWLCEIVSEIEIEIETEMVPLPLYSNGSPVHQGDVAKFCGRPMKVSSMQFMGIQAYRPLWLVWFVDPDDASQNFARPWSSATSYPLERWDQ